MANFFDQFDAPSKPAGGNFFDQFDAPSEAKKPEGGLVASLKQTGGQMVKSAGQLAADVLPGVDRDNALTRTGQGIIDANPTAVHSLADVADSPWTATKEAVGNAAASIGGVVGARLLGQGITAAAPLAGPAAPLVAGIGQGISWLGPTAMAALPSYGGIREQQIAADPNNEGSLASKALAGAGAATVGLIENRFGPQEWALKALSQGGRDALAKQFAANSLAGAIGKGMVKGAAIEGAEELVQNPVEQLASYQDPTTAANLQDTAFGGVMGALGGGVLGGGAGGLSRMITPSQPQQEQPTQPPQPAIDPNAGPLSKAASMATQTPDLNPLAFTPMQPTGPELETDAQTQERMRAAQFAADAMPFERPLSFEQPAQPVRQTTSEGMPFERIGPEDYDTLNPIRVGEGELLDRERPAQGQTRAPDAIGGQEQRRIGVADDGQQDQGAPERAIGGSIQPPQAAQGAQRALPSFTDQKAEIAARKSLPFANEPAAQKKADELAQKRSEPFIVIPHPALANRFAVVPMRNLRAINEQGQAAQLAARAQAGQPGAMPRVEQGTQQSAPDGIAAPAPATPFQTQPSTESVTNGLPPVENLAQEAQAARGQEGAQEKQVSQSELDRLDLEDRYGKPKLRARIAEGKEPLYGTDGDGFVAYASTKPEEGDATANHVRLNPTAEERKAAKVAMADMELADNNEERQEARSRFNAALRPSVDRALQAQPASTRGGQAETVSAAQPQAPQSDQFGNANKMVEQPSEKPEFDVSTRTDDQLRYLTVSGKPGWKEAAQAELARRQGTPQGERNGLQEEGRREEVAPTNTDEVKKVAKTIHDSIADNVLKSRANYLENEVARGFKTREKADDELARDAKSWAESPPNERVQRIAQAIIEKDARSLVGAWAKKGQGTYGNEGSMAAFEKITGVKLRRLNSAQRAKAIFDWAGWTEAQVAEDVAARRAAIAESDRQRQEKDDEATAAQAERTPIKIRETGEVTNVRAYVDGLIADGYTEIRTTKRGAVTKTLLTNSDGYGRYLSSGIVKEYAEIAARRVLLKESAAKLFAANIESGSPAEQPPSDRFRAEVERRKQEREGPKQDNERTEYPFGKVGNGEEDRFFRSRVRVLPAMRGDTAWEGEVGSVLNGGRLIDVKRDGQDYRVRIPGDRIEVLDRVDSREPQPSAPEQKAAQKPENNDRPNPGRYVQPRGDGSVQQQKALADRGGRIATLMQLNDAAGNPYSFDEIQGVADDRIDAVRDYLVEKQRPTQQAQEQPKQAEQPSAPAAQEAQTNQTEPFPVNPELESLFESLDGTSTRKANKAKKAIQADPRADKINLVQDKFLDILQALEDSGAVKINCK